MKKWRIAYTGSSFSPKTLEATLEGCKGVQVKFLGWASAAKLPSKIQNDTYCHLWFCRPPSKQYKILIQPSEIRFHCSLVGSGLLCSDYRGWLTKRVARYLLNKTSFQGKWKQQMLTANNKRIISNIFLNKQIKYYASMPDCQDLFVKMRDTT